MRLTVTARHHLDPTMRAYAAEKLAKLDRHDGGIHEARIVLEEDDRRVPRAAAEVVVHLHHNQLVARFEGVTLQEAIDRVVDRIDRQIVRRKEKVKEHKGKPAAGSDPLAPAPRHVEGSVATESEEAPAAADPVASRRRVTLHPMSVEAAVDALERNGEPFLLFLDEDGGELCLLIRDGSGDIELVVGDTR